MSNIDDGSICPICGVRNGEVHNALMHGAATQDMQNAKYAPPNRFRAFMIDGTAYDFYLNPDMTFEKLVAHLHFNNFMATKDIFIQRDSIVKIMRVYEGPQTPVGNVIPFPEPKGNA